MQFKKIRRINKGKIILGGVIALGVIGAITILPSFAKYRLTDSINIANGIVNYKDPDFQIVAIYKSEDGLSYIELNDRMPSSGYVINESKSYCNLITGPEDPEAVLKTINGDHVIANLIKGDKCYLYFDKEKSPSEKTLANLGLTPSTGTPDFSKASPNDVEGIFVEEDGMYSGTSYYWRGAVTNNYVKFAGFCWRIIRINGDGTIRLIYDGTTCNQNGTGTPNSIVKTSQVYNSNRFRSEYVGYTYTEGNQRTLSGTASNLKTQTDSWYDENFASYDSQIATGKFCNDRNTASGDTWSTQPSSTFYYAARERLESSKTPTLACPEGDVYTLKAGAITADEVSFAGGVYGIANSSYYLFNGKDYWTISPYNCNYLYSNYSEAKVFITSNNGSLNEYGTYGNIPGIRSVINLRSGITFSSGDGTLNNPFIVAD